MNDLLRTGEKISGKVYDVEITPTQIQRVVFDRKVR